MKKWIENLLNLQTLDMRIKKMKVRLRDIPIEKKQASNELKHELLKAEEVKESIKQTELEIKKVDSKVDVYKEKINGYKNKSALVKKNDEYRALMTEVETCKYHIDELEAGQIALMDELEKKKTNLSNFEKACKNLKIDYQETEEELDELAENLKTEIESSMKKRKDLKAKVDPSVLPIYSRLIKKDGEPLCPTKNGTCGNCHLKLTPQTLNDSKKGMVSTCDFCGHLVYYPEY